LSRYFLDERARVTASMYKPLDYAWVTNTQPTALSGGPAASCGRIERRHDSDCMQFETRQTTCTAFFSKLPEVVQPYKTLIFTL
jgi:hypothetical protein